MKYTIQYENGKMTLTVVDLPVELGLKIVDILNGHVKGEAEQEPQLISIAKSVLDRVGSEPTIIPAIKELRARTNLGLKEAKLLIDYVLGRNTYEACDVAQTLDAHKDRYTV